MCMICQTNTKMGKLNIQLRWAKDKKKRKKINVYFKTGRKMRVHNWRMVTLSISQDGKESDFGVDFNSQFWMTCLCSLPNHSFFFFIPFSPPLAFNHLPFICYIYVEHWRFGFLIHYTAKANSTFYSWIEIWL